MKINTNRDQRLIDKGIIPKEKSPFSINVKGEIKTKAYK
jgi:hypothetical protein